MNQSNDTGGPSTAAGGTIATNPASVDPVRKVSLNDIVTLLTLLLLFFCALIFPRSAWPGITRGLGRLHYCVKPPDLAATANTLNDAGLEASQEQIGIKLLAGTYLENIEALSEYLAFRSGSEIVVSGLENIERALQKGRGVILWNVPNCGAQVISLRAFTEAGLPVTRLQSANHPFSGTAFGAAVLNRLRTHIERRHLADTVLLAPDAFEWAMVRLMMLLRKNGIVWVAAIGSGDDPLTTPFLGGTLKVARGVPKMAVVTGAPIIPAWLSIKNAPRYEIDFEPPLEIAEHGSEEERQQQIVDVFAHRLAARLRSEPYYWRGWVMKHTWSP